MINTILRGGIMPNQYASEDVLLLIVSLVIACIVIRKIFEDVLWKCHSELAPRQIHYLRYL